MRLGKIVWECKMVHYDTLMMVNVPSQTIMNMMLMNHHVQLAVYLFS